MKRALFLAHQALLLNKVPVGAVIVYDNFEIGSGFNSSNFNNCVFHHAEFISLKQCFFYLSNHLSNNIVLYVTLEPCAMCRSSLFFSRINRIVFAAHCNKINFTSRNSDRISIRGGILEAESMLLLKNFFLRRRCID